MKKILWVDDHPHSPEIIKKVLEHFGVKTLIANFPEEALKIIAENGDIDLAMVDLILPPSYEFEEGVLLAQEINKISDVPIVLFSSCPEGLHDRGQLDKKIKNFFGLIERPTGPNPILQILERL